MLIAVLLLCAGAAVAPIRTGRLGETPVALAGVAPPPPMGWNTWNSYGCDIDARLVEHAADALVSTGMRDAGYRYVIVDDCWFAPGRAKDGALQADPTRFPGGMRALADYVHARGLKFGLYESPNTRTCAQVSGSYPGSTGSRGHERLDAATFAAWGVDYLKYDWCSTESDPAAQVGAFIRMRDALRATGRPIVYSINPNSDIARTPPGARYDWSGVATTWRTTNDLLPGWKLREGPAGDQGLREVLDATGPLTARQGPDHWLDPDMLVLGVPGVPGTSYPGLTLAEQRTQLGMWAMLAAPLIAGNPLAFTGVETVNLLTDAEVIAVDQDPLGAPAQPVAGTGEKVWRRALSDGSLAIALTNSDDSPARITVPLGELRLTPSNHYVARNLWDGRAMPLGGALSVEVAAHDTALFRVGSR